MPSLTRVLTQLADLDGPGRSLFLVLVGGGVVGDLGGLAAGLYRRGIPYVHVPTTLLAQVDSSIGGKTGVDLPHGKNLVGLFNQPHLVFIEMGFLRTLPDRQLRSGLAEVIKCGIIRDPELFSFLERASASHPHRLESSLAWVVARSVRVKVAAVETDERETQGVRTLLNFGHTFGHALEAATGYTAYAHGEAVALGMTVAARISCRLGRIPPPAVERIENLIRRLGLPTTLRTVRYSRLLRAMSHDKKWKTGRNLWVLPTRIGHAALHKDVPHQTVWSVIQSIVEPK